jgi:putative Mn2+ efflux pump MntP
LIEFKLSKESLIHLPKEVNYNLFESFSSEILLIRLMGVIDAIQALFFLIKTFLYLSFALFYFIAWQQSIWSFPHDQAKKADKAMEKKSEIKTSCTKNIYISLRRCAIKLMLSTNRTNFCFSFFVSFLDRSVILSDIRNPTQKSINKRNEGV